MKVKLSVDRLFQMTPQELQDLFWRLDIAASDCHKLVSLLDLMSLYYGELALPFPLFLLSSLSSPSLFFACNAALIHTHTLSLCLLLQSCILWIFCYLTSQTNLGENYPMYVYYACHIVCVCVCAYTAYTHTYYIQSHSTHNTLPHLHHHTHHALTHCTL